MVQGNLQSAPMSWRGIATQPWPSARNPLDGHDLRGTSRAAALATLVVANRIGAAECNESATRISFGELDRQPRVSLT